MSGALADHHDGLADNDRCPRPGDVTRGSRPGNGGGGDCLPALPWRRGAPRAGHPGAPESPVEFLRGEVVEICGALALGETLLRRLGLVAEAKRIEALFGGVADRLAEA